MTSLLGRWTYPILASGLFLVGCNKEDVTSFSVPKDAPPQRPASAPASAQMLPIRWSTPPGWQELPAGGMRVGSFAVTRGEQKADVSIIPLGGISGSELDNVNRWRGQVGLEPVDQDSLTASAEKVVVAGKPSSLYDLAGSDPKTKEPARILAAILSGEGTTWFFKMVGPDALVAQEKPAFRQLLESVRLEAPSSPQGLPEGHPPLQPPSGELPEGHPPVPTGANALPPTPGEDLATSSTVEKPAWEVPESWQEQTAGSVRVATFAVSGESGAKVDVSVIKLAGDGGGHLANVNRWRAQVGLQPVDEAGLAALVSTREIPSGTISLVDLSGQSMESGGPIRLLVATVPRGDSTWFYKMLGDGQLVAGNKDAFIQFVETARYPHAL